MGSGIPAPTSPSERRGPPYLTLQSAENSFMDFCRRNGCRVLWADRPTQGGFPVRQSPWPVRSPVGQGRERPRVRQMPTEPSGEVQSEYYGG
jgi:hypothetical protein